ncbi:MAG TPA: hypothetical protein EYQ20_11535 [candidate division Zixibacteria bacterium]|nr:hypothetical protein [candidate division Zixibacteria bacterium]
MAIIVARVHLSIPGDTLTDGELIKATQDGTVSMLLLVAYNLVSSDAISLAASFGMTEPALDDLHDVSMVLESEGYYDHSCKDHLNSTRYTGYWYHLRRTYHRCGVSISHASRDPFWWGWFCQPVGRDTPSGCRAETSGRANH